MKNAPRPPSHGWDLPMPRVPTDPSGICHQMGNLWWRNSSVTWAKLFFLHFTYDLRFEPDCKMLPIVIWFFRKPLGTSTREAIYECCILNGEKKRRQKRRKASERKCELQPHAKYSDRVGNRNRIHGPAGLQEENNSSLQFLICREK